MPPAHFYEPRLVFGLSITVAILATINYSGAKETVAGDINNNDQIVGTYRDVNDNIFGFIKVGGTFAQIALPCPVQNVGLVSDFDDNVPLLSFLEGVNDKGEISGEFLGSDGRSHGFIGTPTRQNQQ